MQASRVVGVLYEVKKIRSCTVDDANKYVETHRSFRRSLSDRYAFFFEVKEDVTNIEKAKEIKRLPQ